MFYLGYNLLKFKTIYVIINIYILSLTDII